MLFACKMMQFTALNPTNNHAKCLKKQDDMIGITTKNHVILHNFLTRLTLSFDCQQLTKHLKRARNPTEISLCFKYAGFQKAIVKLNHNH